MYTDEPRSLDECWERIHELEEDNDVLRKSANSFGGLAERLRDTLEVERRSGGERRARGRPGQARRRHFGSPPE